MPESSNKGGRIPRVSDSDLLDVFRSSTDPVLSTAEVADAVPIQRRGVLNRLRNLEADEELKSKQIGGRNTVWWLTADESGETPARDAAPDSEGEHRPADSPADTDARDATPGAGGYLPDLTGKIPGDGDHLEGRIQAVRDIYDYLKEHGRGQRSDFKDVVDVEATGYGGETPFNSFWNNCMDSGGLLADLPGVKSPGEGGHAYTYTGDAPEGS
jgi:hypothetical protein